MSNTTWRSAGAWPCAGRRCRTSRRPRSVTVALSLIPEGGLVIMSSDPGEEPGAGLRMDGALCSSSLTYVQQFHYALSSICPYMCTSDLRSGIVRFESGAFQAPKSSGLSGERPGDANGGQIQTVRSSWCTTMQQLYTICVSVYVICICIGVTRTSPSFVPMMKKAAE